MTDESPVLSRDVVERAYDDAVRRWAADRRAAAAAFARETFGLRGAARLHRHALGRDLYRAPANAALGLVAFGRMVAAAAAGGVGAKRAARGLRSGRLFLATDVGRAVERKIMTEFLGLPRAAADGDALWAEMAADPRIATALEDTFSALAARAEDPDARRRVEDAVSAYVDDRGAAGEIASNLMIAAAGYAAFQKLTPGALAVTAPAASAIAGHVAINSFWAGPWAGALVQAIAPAAASPALYAGVFLGAMAPAAVAAAFAGVVVDPLLMSAGVHRRRLVRLVDAAESALLRRDDGAYAPRAIYVARVFDIVDVAHAAARALRA